MDKEKIHRLVGMLLFSAIVLLIFWYWELGQWDLVRVRRVAPAGHRSLVSSFLQQFGLSSQARTHFWFLSQPLVVLAAWLLRASLGKAVARVHDAV
jgi:hypothetical protein